MSEVKKCVKCRDMNLFSWISRKSNENARSETFVMTMPLTARANFVYMFFLFVFMTFAFSLSSENPYFYNSFTWKAGG